MNAVGAEPVGPYRAAFESLRDREGGSAGTGGSTPGRAKRRAARRRRLVYFQASSRGAGKPSAANRSKAAARWASPTGRRPRAASYSVR